MTIHRVTIGPWKLRLANSTLTPFLQSYLGLHLHPSPSSSPSVNPPMHALRATALRSSRRSFATVADSSGVKIAALDHGQPTSAVTFLVKAGSRYEPQPGVANVLKNFAFKVRI